jgi:hypothetical protein
MEVLKLASYSGMRSPSGALESPPSVPRLAASGGSSFVLEQGRNGCPSASPLTFFLKRTS